MRRHIASPTDRLYNAANVYDAGTRELFAVIFTPFAVPVFVSAGMYMLLAVYVLRQRGVPAAAPFGSALLMASAWSWSYAFDLSLTGLTDKILTTMPRFMFISVMMVCWLMMALQHSGRGHWLNRRRLGALLVMPAITTLLSFTIGQHQLFRYDFELREMGTLALLVSKNGPWYYAYMAYSYALGFGASLLLAASLRNSSTVYRRQTWLIILVGIMPALADIVFQSPFNPLPGFNMATTVFMFGGGMVAWALFHHRFLDLAPVAREKVFEAIRDIVIVVEPGGRIVDLNPAAQELLGLHYVRAVGKKMEEVFSAWPDLAGICTGETRIEAEIYLRQGISRRCYEIHCLPLTDRSGRAMGRLITLRDATERVQAQARELEQVRTRALLQSRDRLDREIAELLHGPVQTKLLIAWQKLSDCHDLLRRDPGKVETLLCQAQKLIDEVREHDVRQASHRLHPSLIAVGLVPAVASLVDNFQGNARLDLDIEPEVKRLDDPCCNLIPGPVRLAAYRILEEALGNVYRHAKPTSVRISLGIDVQGHLGVTSEDNGCGFDPTESTPGLGLTVIAGQAEQVGGTWQVTSAVGQGTRVSALLPLQSSALD